MPNIFSRIIRLLYTGYGLICFVILFFILFPFFIVPIIFPKKFKWVGILNRIWARLLFALVFIPYKVEYRKNLDPKKQYIFCPNHFSYVDIATMGLNQHNTIFVGKSDMESIPLFGFMYRKLHITVNRESLKSRSNTLKQSLQAIDEGKSLVIFPEGGIITEKDPILHRFKDGAFRVAIEKQIELVPVTIPYNWIIMPPDQFLLRRHKMKLIFHEPITTTGMTTDDIDSLKQSVFDIINNELNEYVKP